MALSARLGGRGLLTLILLGALAWSLLGVDWGKGVLHHGGRQAVVEIAAAFVRPDLSAETLRLAVVAAWRTLAYAVAGTSLASLLAAPLGILAAGVTAHNRWSRAGLIGVFRSLLAFLRAIHELVWAWLLVAAIGLSPLAAVLALALPYAGILGRILAGMLADVPAAPLRALCAAGAGPWQVLLYGRLPLALPDMLSYTLYRFECAIRSAAIMSFVGLGGLGFEIQLSLQDLKYHEAWTFIFFLFGLVVLIDLWSSALRRRLTA